MTSRQHGAVAHAGIEYPQRRRPGVDTAEFQRHPLRDDPLFAAGMYEQQVFLAILEKPEVATGIALLGQDFKATRWRYPARRRGGDIGLDAVEGVDGDALALAQPVYQLAVVHGAAAKGRLGHIGLTAEVGNLAQDLVVFHGDRQVGSGGWDVCLTIICPPLGMQGMVHSR